jgi:hypothetical protein
MLRIGIWRYYRRQRQRPQCGIGIDNSRGAAASEDNVLKVDNRHIFLELDRTNIGFLRGMVLVHVRSFHQTVRPLMMLVHLRLHAVVGLGLCLLFLLLL